MKTYLFTLSFLSALGAVSGHARIREPKPLGYGSSPQLTGNGYNKPLAYDGSDFPCKGLIDKVDMNPVATWKAGGTASFEIQPNDDPSGGEGQLAAHSGGSCQISLSFDKGKTWKVLQSYIGGCPRGVKPNSNIGGPDQKFQFPVPASTKSGNVLAAWTWIANTGNRGEFYMNCASVKIDGTGTSTLDTYPDMWVGDLVKAPITKEMCLSTGGTNLEYPNPGANPIKSGNGTPPKGPGPDGKFTVCRSPGTSTSPPSDPPKNPPPQNPPPQNPPPQNPPPQNPPNPGQAIDVTWGGVTYSCMPKAPKI